MKINLADQTLFGGDFFRLWQQVAACVDTAGPHPVGDELQTALAQANRLAHQLWKEHKPVTSPLFDTRPGVVRLKDRTVPISGPSVSGPYT